ncbi:MAG: multidrug effflux MFS transporter [Rickettsiales bacterium]|nr:multidrug effflux MFS transporter [Rickettsiales bacterium]
MKEFIILMASLTAMVALSIDAMLPALQIMGADLHVMRANDMQYVISFIFIGMAIGQVVYGPLADHLGRKPTLFIGLGLFIGGCLLSYMATSLPLMLLGRFIQGLGVASPRIMTMAIVRDKYEGREMARVMSMVMGVFIMVPAIAPSLGQVIMHLWGWRAIFMFYILAAVMAFLWAAVRLEETLTPKHHRPFNLRTILSGFKEAAMNRATMGYTACGGLIFGAMLGYLNSSQQIFQEIYQAGDMFAVYFGVLAVCIGAAFFCNSALVRRLGMRNITRHALHALVICSCIFLAYTLIAPVPLLVFMLVMGVTFFCLGLMFGNMTALALEPMGHMAGLASAFNGAVSSVISLLLGMLIGQEFGGTLLPLAVGFVALSIATWLLMRWVEKPTRHPS